MILDQAQVNEILTDLWANYYDSDKKLIKPPTVERVTRLYAEANDTGFIETLRALRALFKNGEYESDMEKDNCGIHWRTWSYKGKDKEKV